MSNHSDSKPHEAGKPAGSAPEKFGLLGFRSNKTWKKVICVIYLVFVALTLVLSLIVVDQFDATPVDTIVSKATGVISALTLLAPVVAFSNFRCYKKIPLLKSQRIGPRIAAFFIYIAVLTLLGSALFCLHSPQYNAAYEDYQLRLTQEQADAMLEEETVTTSITTDASTKAQ